MRENEHCYPVVLNRRQSAHTAHR